MSEKGQGMPEILLVIFGVLLTMFVIHGLVATKVIEVVGIQTIFSALEVLR